MPYHIEGKCVYKDGESEPIKCHETEQEAKDHLAALYANVDKSIVVFDGGAVKALPDNKIGGYLVTFGGVDMTGDYFTDKTDFGEYSKLPVLYHHGFDEKIKTRRIGTAEIRQDEVGLWAEAQLNMRDEYEQMVYEMAKAGKLGWSSGAAAHVVQKELDTKGAQITQWYMAEASLTPCPAEPRNSVMTLKTFLGDTQTETEPTPEAEAEKPAQKVEAEAEVANQKGVYNMEMTDEKLQEILATNAEQAAEAAVKAFVAAQPSDKEPDVEVVTDEADNALKGGWKFPGEFFMAVKRVALSPMDMDKRLLPLKAGQGANEAVPSEGGFLVEQSVAPGIFERMYDQGTVLGQFVIDPVGPNSNGMSYPTIDETSRADGSRWGGIQGYWMAEGGTKTASHPAFSKVDLKLKKVAALCYATDELLEDSTALGAWLQRTVPNELRFLSEAAILNGNGVGKPLGIRQSPSFITEPRTAASLAALTAAEIAAVWSRRWVGAKDYIWLVDPSVLPGLMGLTIGNFPVFMPPNGLQGTPASMLFGRPVYEVEYLPTVAATTGIMGLMLVAPSQYALIDKGGIQSASSIHVSFVTDETAFRFVYRIDGSPMWSSALTPYSGGETVSPFVALGSTSS
jgi:HK97 family phage major capsid protein